MSDLIEFLEKVGMNSLHHATADDLEQALVRAEIDPALRVTIFGAPRHELETLLGAPANICCALHAPEEEEEEEEDETDGEEDPGDDDKEDGGLTSRQFTPSRVTKPF